MQRSLTILCSVVAPLTLFITSKLVIRGVHGRSCSGEGSRYARKHFPADSWYVIAHATRQSCLTLERRAGNRNRWQENRMILINAARIKRENTRLACRWRFVRGVLVLRAIQRLRLPLSRVMFFFFPLHPSARFRSRPGFSGEISWKICRAGFIRCRSSRLTWSCRCPFSMIATFFFYPLFFFYLLRFCREEQNSCWIASSRLVSRNKTTTAADRAVAAMIDTLLAFSLKSKIVARPRSEPRWSIRPGENGIVASLVPKKKKTFINLRLFRTNRLIRRIIELLFASIANNCQMH